MVPKMNAYRRDFDETKYMSFLIKNEEFLEKYNDIWDIVSKVIKKGSDSEPVCNNKYLKAKIKSDEGKINTDFRINKDAERRFSILLPIAIFDLFYFQNG